MKLVVTLPPVLRFDIAERVGKRQQKRHNFLPA